MIDKAYPDLARMVELQLAVFPDHADYLARRFAGMSQAHMRFTDDVAGLVLRIGGSGIDTICEDYKWLCAEMLEEELYFRRHDRYQLSTFQEALDKVYANPEFMTRYVNGILASQLWWHNHTEAMQFLRDTFVPGNPQGFSHLEVGPGHGLYLYLAARSPKCGSAEGWDVSPSSLEKTRACLKAMGDVRDITLREIELTQAPERTFQSITFSEVLEHLEDPLAALKILHRLLAKGGRIFVNAPVNSPAPDHLYLFRTPEDVAAMVEKAGFKVVDTLYSPCTGATLERARKLKLSISACVIATKE
jgi:ubiquinone/menaquinone biosynthesis C-methylase UbiE